MDLNHKTYSVATIGQMQNRIDPRPDYQRPLAWSVRQKQLLIDSILRGYDVPKLYWEELKEQEFRFAVIDGQQRITTLWSFLNDEFAVAKDADPIGEEKIAGKKYSQLSDDVLDDFNSYQLNIVIVKEANKSDDEDEIRDMFLRLQNGTTLKAQEKRNAMSGNMRKFVQKIAKHEFFEKCKFSNSRLTYDHIAAQMVCLEMNGGPSSVRDSNLTKMYEENRQFDENSKVARKVLKVLDFLNDAFPHNNTQDLERYNALNMYLLCSVLVEKYVSEPIKKEIEGWLSDFEKNRLANDKLDEDDRDLALVEYKRLTSYSTDGEESIKGRLEFIERNFFSAFPNITQLDENRNFTSEQRLAIFKENNGRCQLKLKCVGEERLAWDDWHADHIVPFSKGGQTTVANGQVSCVKCNTSKGNSS